MLSLPLRECGLKSKEVIKWIQQKLSLPLRECGLKFEEMINCFKITERLRRRYLKGFCWHRSFKAPLKAVSHEWRYCADGEGLDAKDDKDYTAGCDESKNSLLCTEWTVTLVVYIVWFWRVCCGKVKWIFVIEAGDLLDSVK